MRLLLLALLTTAAQPQTVRYECQPDPAVLTAMHHAGDLLSGRTLDRRDALDQARAAMRRALRDHPGDIPGHLRYLALFRRQGSDGVIAEYRAARDAHPGDPRYALFYAASQVGTDTPAALRELTALTESHPDFPFSYLVTAEVHDFPRFKDPGAVADNVLRFLRACPAYLPAYQWLRRTGSGEEFGQAAVRLRQLLAGRTDRDAIDAYPALWAMEFRAQAPGAHPALRTRVAQDLASLRAVSPLDPAMLRTLRDGYRLTGDTAALRALPKPPAEVEPVYAALHEWLQANPYPKSGAAPAEKERWSRARAQVAEAWVAKWPDEPMPYNERFAALAALPDTPAASLAAAGEALIAIARRRPGRFLTTPATVTVAQAYLVRGIHLDAIPQLLEAGLREADTRPRLPASDLFDDLNQRQDAQIRYTARVTARRVEFDWSLKTAHHPRAHAALAGMRQDLDELQKVSEQPRCIPSLETQYWKMMIQLADAEGRKEDAALYRVNAAREEKVPGRVVVGASGEWLRLEQRLPPLRAASLDGRQWTDADLAGKVAVMSLWATWCGPCVQELASVQKLYEKLKGRPEVVVLSLNIDDNAGVVEPFLKGKGYTFPVLLAHGYVEQALGSVSIPRNWLVTAGTLRREYQGFGEPVAWLNGILSQVEEMVKPQR
jgi:thiol-disulfide isomerase/thioredoxin